MNNTKPTIMFAHANGFPSPTYRKFFSYLSDEYTIDAIDNVGHQSDYPVNDNWRYLALELQHHIEKNANGPIIGIGHSLGGVLHLITALQCPHYYSQLIILDSPLYGPIKSLLLKLYKRCHWMHRITPSKSSARRHNRWPDKQAALTYFKGKSLYKHFDEDCFQDYITFGTKIVDGYLQLLTKPEIEGEIFNNLPDNLAWCKPKIPTAFVYAKNGHVINKIDRLYLQYKFDLFGINGGHLFPFERPKETAALIKRIIFENKC